MDLFANELATFRKVTLPLIAPAILAGFLLAFALSVDDFVITNFNAGTTVTFPLFVWGAARVSTPPQINVIGTAIFVVAVTLMLVNTLPTLWRTPVATSAMPAWRVASMSCCCANSNAFSTLTDSVTSLLIPNVPTIAPASSRIRRRAR